MSSSRSPSCPSDLALEEHLLRPDAQVAHHVEHCAHCARWLKDAEAAAQEIEAHAPRLIARALASLPRRGPGRQWMMLPAIPAAALAAVLMLWPRADTGPSWAVKGGELTVFVQHGGQVRAAQDGEKVRAGDELRFLVAPPRPQYVWIASLDSLGRLSRLVPADGDRPLRVGEPGLLPGGAVLDGTAGPERIYAILSDSLVSWSAVEEAFGQAMGSERGEQLVRRGPVLRLTGARHATVILEREAP